MLDAWHEQKDSARQHHVLALASLIEAYVALVVWTGPGRSKGLSIRSMVNQTGK